MLQLECVALQLGCLTQPRLVHEVVLLADNTYPDMVQEVADALWAAVDQVPVGL